MRIGEGYSLAVLSGPTFAKELAMGMPTAISVASPDADFVADLQEKIHCSKTFRVYANSDFIGMQLRRCSEERDCDWRGYV